MQRLRRRRGDPKLDRLAALPLFAGIGKSELSEVARLIDEVEVPPGKILMKEGRPGWDCFVVAEGTATVRKGGTSVASIGPGAVVGDTALLGDGLRSATVEADTAMKLFVLGSRGFHALMDHATVARRLEEQVAARAHAAGAVDSSPA